MNDELLKSRIKQATEVERKRLTAHLSIDEDSQVDQIIAAYLAAADNSIVSIARPIIGSELPTYSHILRLIYRELRTYSEALDETWKAVKSLKFWAYESPVDSMNDMELEDRIFKMYAAEYSDAQKKLLNDPSLWSKATKYLPGMTSAAASTAATVGATTATKLPFMAAAPGAVAGPVGIALAVVLMSVQASGPAFRKIVPATVELMLIGRRIKFMPKD